MFSEMAPRTSKPDDVGLHPITPTGTSAFRNSPPHAQRMSANSPPATPYHIRLAADHLRPGCISCRVSYISATDIIPLVLTPSWC
ncbi:hypothetical protein BDZ97DRAFT_1841056 [Flammula alnicola]|nr:hypothetical protein BDZ97DRAFT_1841056 [Flammula alnicola]